MRKTKRHPFSVGAMLKIEILEPVSITSKALADAMACKGKEEINPNLHLYFEDKRRRDLVISRSYLLCLKFLRSLFDATKLRDFMEFQSHFKISFLTTAKLIHALRCNERR